MMKQFILLLISLMLALTLIACSEVPEGTVPSGSIPSATEPSVSAPPASTPVDPTTPDVTEPQEIPDLIYDLSNDQWLSDIFEDKTIDEWNAMGQYTLRLEGLHTLVVLNMDGTSVLSISAFDQTVDLGTDGMADDYHDGYSPVQRIRSTNDAVVIHVSFGEMGDGSILITKNQIFKYPKGTDSSIFLWVKDDGTLGYRQTWVEYGNIEQEGYYALTWLTARDQMLYQNGSAEIADGELVLTAEETVVLSDLCDPDAMFAEGKAAGMFEQYETVDQLFAANAT